MYTRELREIFQALIFLVFFYSSPAFAVEQEITQNLISSGTNEDYVIYQAEFFARFQPITALDMVSEIPGFQLEEETEEIRGFSETAGNVLINDRRPSAKQDSLSSILSRISADSVERVELIRQQVRSIDMRGEPLMVNIVLIEDNPAIVQWKAELERRFNYGKVAPSGLISLSDKWKDIEFNAGLEGRHEPAGRTGVDRIFDNESNIIENRFDHREIRNHYLKGNFNTATIFGETLIQFNSSLQYDFDYVTLDSRRVPKGFPFANRNDFVRDDEDTLTLEAGLDIERDLTLDITGKFILLYSNARADLLSIQKINNEFGIETLEKVADSTVKSTETITRLEFDWDALSGHLLQLNMERALNTLGSQLQRTDNMGLGPVIVDVPGANSRVKEERWDFELKDTWRLGLIELDYGLGAEASTISQTGDVFDKRDFFFLKPQFNVTYSNDNGYLSRLSLNREVAQLNLSDFVSATVFDEDDLALGNPDLRPDRSWILELVQEKRFGSNGVVKITAFHHWITDVLDLLPLTTAFEAPGNIGDGRRWGIIFDSTLPLDWLKLSNAKLNFRFRVQDSTVVDPVTGKARTLSLQGGPGGGIRFLDENQYAWFIEYRQDFQISQVSWGWNAIERGERYLFKVNELEVFNEGMDINLFIETTRWFGIKTRITAENILNFQEQRDRSVFAGERDITNLDSIERRRRTRGAQLFLTVSGSF